MNLFYKLLLATIISLPINARDIIVITAHPTNITKINLIKKIITMKIKIPEELITWKTKNRPCTPIKDAIVHICYKNGDIKFPVFKNEIVQESFNIFKQNQGLSR
jgi:hypothetical protein